MTPSKKFPWAELLLSLPGEPMATPRSAAFWLSTLSTSDGIWPFNREPMLFEDCCSNPAAPGMRELLA
jgi:hypothetical protein